MLRNKLQIKQTSPSNSYSSNITAMIGTLFLWLLWPSFNAGNMIVKNLSTNAFRIHSVLNTIISLMGSCLTSVGMSIFLRNGKINMEDVLNGSLAGGVIIGAASSIIQRPIGALIIGSIAGIVTTAGFVKLSPYLKQRGLQDVCGIVNLHAFPGLLGGLYSGLIFGIYTLNPPSIVVNVDTGFSYSKQAEMQIFATFLTIGMAVFSGLLTGKIMNYSQTLDSQDFFKDQIYWIIPDLPATNSSTLKKQHSKITNQKFRPDAGQAPQVSIMEQTQMFFATESKDQ